MQRLRTLHLFAGAGGGILGDLLLGHQPVCAVEIDEYCQQVLSARQKDGSLPWFPIFADVTQFDGRPWRGIVDVISGGFPCQAWSNACSGKNRAANLWPQMLRVIGEVCPNIVFAENVDEGAIIMVQNDLTKCGYKAYRCKVSASDLGADHIRGRWWLLAHSNNKGKLFGKINAKMEVLQEFRCSVWDTNPEQPGVSDGVAARVDRLTAIGNGQVPAVAALAWETLIRR